MKIAFYIEDGLEQIVLTPESKNELSMLAKLHDGTRELSIKRGNFYYCQGGWVRHGFVHHDLYGSAKDDESTMIILTPKGGE